MEGTTPLEKAALAITVLAAGSVAALVGPDGYPSQPALAFGTFLAGLLASVATLALALRAGRPGWLRCAAAGGFALFAATAGWLAYFLSTVPLG